MLNFRVLWTMNLSNIKVLTKWDSKGSHIKCSILVLRLSIYLQMYINKTHSLEVSKKRNAALMTTLKEKTDLILDVVHLHEKNLHHLEEKLDQTNKLLADLLESNIWFSSKVTDTIEMKFQSVVHHHENVIKLAQHHRLTP